MNYLYLYQMADQSHYWCSDQPPTETETQTVIDGDLLVYRLDRNDPSARYEFFEPIDSTDPDSWSEVPF